MADDVKSALEGLLGSAADGEAGGLPAEANPYEDYAEINKRIERALETDKFTRAAFQRSWFRNVLFDVGQHWIIYDARESRWKKKKLPEWFPRAQTNKFAEKKSDLMSVLIQSKPPINYSPATDDPDDEATVEVAERMRDVIYEECGIDDKEEELASWVILTGNGFLLPYYDAEANGKTFIPQLQCESCKTVYAAEEVPDGQCVECAAQGLPSGLVEAMDEAGEPLGEEYPIGCVNADVCSPFEIRLDFRERDWSKHRWFVRLRRYDLEFAKELWPKLKETMSLAETNSSEDFSQHYLDILSGVTDSWSPQSGGNTASGSAKHPKVTVYEYYELPSEKFPEGIRAVRVANGENNIVEAGPLTTAYGAGVKKGEKFLPLVPFGWEVVPGRFWRKTRMDDLIPLQVFRNTIEANLRLTAQRMGNPMWLNPNGSGLEIFSGEPGWIAKYNPVSYGGTSFAKPERIPAELSNLQSLVMLINQIDDAMERIAGTFFLQGGDTPPGVTAASALAYLGERAQKAMSPLMRSWAKGWKRFEELALEIARENWTEERIRVVAGRNRLWESQKFKGDDLGGAVNMKIDFENMFPKSQATRRATVAQLAQLGVVNPLDPEQNWKVLELFGETGLKGSADLDKREAVREAERFMTDEAYQPAVVPFVQNSQVHWMLHADFAKTDEFKELSPEKQEVWLAHIQEHIVDMLQRQTMFGEAAAQAGGQQDGAEGPDARVGPDGKMQPKNAEDMKPGEMNGMETEDIAMPKKKAGGGTGGAPPA